MPPKKRGRKPKNKKNEPKPPPKKRGRKPKGGKIIKNNKKELNNEKYTPNIILHLKVKNNIDEENLTSIQYNPVIQDPKAFTIKTNQKTSNLPFKELEVTNISKEKPKETFFIQKESPTCEEKCKPTKNNMKELWCKLNELKKNLKMNNISDKSSACFWCTHSFDNPPVHIPKKMVDDKVEVYGCFCSPECALSYLKNENIDTSTMWSRYSLLNNIYCKIYNYEKNIKPAPSPYYTLDKFYGNLSIQEYRKLLNNDRLIMVVDKPLTKILPEIYEENNEEPNIMNNLINKNDTKKNKNRYKLKSKKEVKNKMTILKNNFNVF